MIEFLIEFEKNAVYMAYSENKQNVEEKQEKVVFYRQFFARSQEEAIKLGKDYADTYEIKYMGIAYVYQTPIF